MPAPTGDKGLIARALKLVQGFNPVTQTVASYADDSLGYTETVSESSAPPDLLFLRQVLYGCVRHKEALKIFLIHFFSDMAAKVLRSDYTLYMVLGYIVLFRIDELGFEKFKAITADQDPVKMCGLLLYVTDWERMDGQLTAAWLTVFDLAYIQSTIIGGLRRHEDALNTHTAKLELRAYGAARAREAAIARGGVATVEPKPLTVVKPFNLTKPNPRRVPEPMKIEARFQVGPEPTYLETSRSLEEIADERAKKLAESKAATQKKYDEDEAKGRGAFKLHETRNTLDARAKEVEAQTASELTFAPQPARPVPDYSKEGAEVRLTVAAILREDALVKKRQAKDANLIRNFEEELRDSTEYYKWQTEMKTRDAELKLEQVDRKRQAARASAIQAKQALEGQEQANLELGQKLKDEKRAMARQRKAEADLNLMINRQLVKEIAQVRDVAPAEAINALRTKRRNRRDAVQEELEKARQKHEEELKHDSIKRREAVLRLKEQDVHKPHIKVFDPTETPGLGLLNEMSLVEMHERLLMEEQRKKEQEQEKRRQILTAKSEKQEDIKQRLEGLKQMRRAMSSANAEARAKKKHDEAIAEKRLQEKRLASGKSLLQSLEQKRTLRQQEQAELAAEEEAKRKQALYLGRASAALKEEAEDQLRRGAQRTENMYNKMLRDEEQFESDITQTAKANATRNSKTETQKIVRRDREKAAEFESSKARAGAKMRADALEKSEKFQVARDLEVETRRKVAAHNVYADTANQYSIKQGREHTKVLERTRSLIVT